MSHPLMATVPRLLATFTAGFALGSLYFGLLWWTVRQLPDTQRPARLFLVSLLGRMGVLLGGFYLVMNGQWPNLLACLAGFVVARSLLIRRFQPRSVHGAVEGDSL